MVSAHPAATTIRNNYMINMRQILRVSILHEENHDLN